MGCLSPEVLCPQRRALNLPGLKLRGLRFSDVTQQPQPQGLWSQSSLMDQNWNAAGEAEQERPPTPPIPLVTVTAVYSSAQEHNFLSHLWFGSSGQQSLEVGGTNMALIPFFLRWKTLSKLNWFAQSHIVTKKHNKTKQNSEPGLLTLKTSPCIDVSTNRDLPSPSALSHLISSIDI